MARIEALPHPEVIRAFKGTLDYYAWKGLYCVRAWPSRPAMPRSPASQATAQTFADIIRNVPRTTTLFRNAAQEQSQQSTWTWRDELVSGLYGNLFVSPEPSPEDASVLTFIKTSPGFGGQTFNVNNTGFIAPWETQFYVASSSHRFNWYRLWMDAWSNATGQTISAQVATAADPNTALNGSGPNLTLSSTVQRHDTGWLPFDNEANPDQLFVLALRGSNSSVDLIYARIEIHFAVDPLT